MGNEEEWVDVKAQGRRLSLSLERENQMVRCTAPSVRGGNPHIVGAARATCVQSRRMALLSLSVVLPSSCRAAESEEEYVQYKRGTSARFETSISSATRPYSFLHPNSWASEDVSLFDGKLYGIDCRYISKQEGQLSTHVLPFGNRENIGEAGDEREVLETFQELVGAFWYENGFGSTSLDSLKEARRGKDRSGNLTYYYELKPHSYVAATCVDGQLYLLNASASPRQWSQNAGLESSLKTIQTSFDVPP